ncbi:WhiB family transcriptional regulator, redox-sensing transcriptional regulator [Lentzea waywayandensis]|uniref:WhiB family transcriptional regulator, redox-sensing transcriptional regulator n=1 Tax=Lentzea waywayandensis TaxID=84724 RepID=A0A1I6EM32_9PSEU|nr:WhiB family transcriptional regulator, redox-sensing transcriptional regulator [Lentzea waywayandensis]
MVNQENYYELVAAELDRYAKVPDGVLLEIVTRDGACMWLWANEDGPEWEKEEITDSEAAARLCADCPIRSVCLELELRTAGEDTVGVWGGLSQEDRRQVYRAWRARREGGGSS